MIEYFRSIEMREELQTLPKGRLNLWVILFFFAIPFLSSFWEGPGMGLFAQGVAINPTGAPPDNSAIFDVNSTTQGNLFPRMTTAQRDAIASPANGLIIYNIDCNNFNYYNGSAWIPINSVGGSAPATPGSITGNTTVCANATGEAYSISVVSGATAYTWTAPAGATVATGQGTTAITVDYGSTAGNVCVTASNNCGTSTASCTAITINTAPTAVSASGAPDPICEGNTLTLTGGATGATSWSWTGPNSYTSSVQSPTIAGITTAGAGVYTLTASNTCGSAAPVNTASIAVSALPTTANAGTDINPACGVTTATLAGNTPTTGTGLWTVISGTATIITPSSPTSGVTGLVVAGTATLRWTISNAPCTPSADDVVITTTSCAPPPNVCTANWFTDARDGKQYGAVTIGSQIWMCENLAYLPSVVGPATGSSSVAYHYVYGYSGTNVATAKATANYTTYGVLYNWTAAMNGAASSSSSPSG
ncbi:MAG: hypothetical protein COA57_07380, partial [Flavobacteriales bacterium]